MSDDFSGVFRISEREGGSIPSHLPFSPPLSSLPPLPLFSLPFPSLSPISLPLEVGPLNPTRGLRDRCKLPGLPQRGLGRSPSRNRIWCILALKYDIWWQQCVIFSWESSDQIECCLVVHCCVCSAAKFLRQPFGRFIPPRLPFSLCLEGDP